MTTIYIKPMTWAGKTEYYLGLQPSDPTRGHSDRLGGYFLVCKTLGSARAIAESEARAWSRRSSITVNVVECDHYVGL